VAVRAVLHRHRKWQVAPENLSPKALARKLAGGGSWTPCTGFRCGKVLWLCDATGPDGAQEYAIVREEGLRQIESITASWCTPERLLEYAWRFHSGLGLETELDLGTIRPEQIEAAHRPCCHCR